MKFVFVLSNKALDIYLKLCGAAGQAHFGFLILLVKYLDAIPHAKKRIHNHEMIHIKQSRELLVIFWYALYILNYIINWFIYWNHQDAYRNIIFERECYDNDANLNYINERKPFAFLKYFNRRVINNA